MFLPYAATQWRMGLLTKGTGKRHACTRTYSFASSIITWIQRLALHLYKIQHVNKNLFLISLMNLKHLENVQETGRYVTHHCLHGTMARQNTLQQEPGKVQPASTPLSAVLYYSWQVPWEQRDYLYSIAPSFFCKFVLGTNKLLICYYLQGGTIIYYIMSSHSCMCFSYDYCCHILMILHKCHTLSYINDIVTYLFM